MWLLLKLYPDLPGNNELTLDVRGPSYLLDSRSISWLLMPWLLASPGHQHPWYWPCRIGRSVPYLRKDFKYLCHINVEEWHKMWIFVYVPSEKFKIKHVKGWIQQRRPLQPSALTVPKHKHIHHQTSEAEFNFIEMEHFFTPSHKI